MATTTTQPYTAGLLRQLGGLERFFSLVDQHHPLHFAMAAHIEGRKTVSNWRAALDALQQRHPLLSVGIEEDSSTPHFRAQSNAPIPLRVVWNSTLSDWQQEIASELATPFHPQQAPLVRAVVIQGRDESMFILAAHHSIADGLSLAYAVRDTLQALHGEALESLSPMPAQEPLLYLSQESINSIESHAQPAPPPEGRPICFRTLDASLPHVDSLRLTPELTYKLIERSRMERTTVHGALCSALVIAGREISTDWRDSPVRILSPFNLRKQLGIGEDCGVFIWAGIVPFGTKESADFWDIARYAKTALTSRQSLQDILLGMDGLDQAMSAGCDVSMASQIQAQAFPSELLLTNLGSLPSCQFERENLRLKALWGPAVLMGFQGEQTVGVTTTNASLCLLHTSFAPMPSFLQRTEQILLSACATS